MRHVIYAGVLCLIATGCRPASTDVTYTVISESTTPGIKRSLDVCLADRVSEATLRSIAQELKNGDDQSYERTFICYYLPDSDPKAGCWATSHFTPDLEVQIQGLTAEQFAKMTRLPGEDSRDIIGSWLDERSMFSRRITIYRDDDRPLMEQMFWDGSVTTFELAESQANSGKRFDYEPGRNDEHFVIVENGDLQIWDTDGLVISAKRIR